MAQKMLDNYLIKKGDHKTLFSLGTSNSQAFGLFPLLVNGRTRNLDDA